MTASKPEKPGSGADKRPRGSRTPRQNGVGNGVRSREDVVTAAGKLFSTRGYHGTSMRDLARELGLIGSSLYSHIDSKEELLVEVVERGAALFQKSAEAALTVDGPATNRLKALVAGHVDVILNHRDQVRTFLYEADALEGAHRARVLAARDRYEGAFRQVLLEGKNAGLHRRTIDPTLSAIFVLSILNAVDRWYDPGGRLDRGRLVDEILVFALTGINAP